MRKPNTLNVMLIANNLILLFQTLKFGLDKITRQQMPFDLADVNMLNPGQYFCL